MQRPQKRCKQEPVQSTVMERGAGAASLATTDNAVLFFHKAVLFRALFRNSMTTHVQSTSMDACTPPGLFSPQLVFHPPKTSSTIVCSICSLLHEKGYTVPSTHSFWLPVPAPPKSHQVLLWQLLFMNFGTGFEGSHRDGARTPL